MRTQALTPTLPLILSLCLGTLACNELPRPTVTDGRGKTTRPTTTTPKLDTTAVPGDTVTLKFAWPDALDAKVRYTLTGTAAAGQNETFVHTLAAKKLGDVWEVSEQGPLKGSDFTAEELILRGELLAASAVKADGTFSGVLDAAKDQESGQNDMRARFEKAGQGALLTAGMANMYTPAVISRRSASIWRSMVGHWAGKTLTRGKPQEVTFESPVGPASAAQRALELSGELTYVGATRCKRGEVEAKCVALSLKAQADPEKMASTVVDSIASAMLDDAQTARLKDMITVEKAAASREIMLIADPATLLPHKLTITQMLELSVSLQRDPDGPPKRQESVLDHKVERIFSYP